jgi:hypothetical protein
MEQVFKLDHNGQQVQQQDFTTIGQYGLMDDRVFAEFFRMTPYNGSAATKGIVPYHSSAALVAGNGATGTVLVNPFRALVGSRTAVGTDSKKNWRDIRSTIFLGSTTSLTLAVSIGANSSGNPRWDLVYAAVAVDANDTTTTRKVKDPTTKVVTEQTVSTSQVTTVTVGVQAGTAAASPVWPSAPSDSGGTYYIPLAYVRVPNGFGASSTVAATDIAVTASCIPISRALGVCSLQAGTTHRAMTTSQQQSWGSTGTRPRTFLPSSFVGGESLFFILDLQNASPSHANGATIDTRDWRNRYVRWMAITEAASGETFASDLSMATAANRDLPRANRTGKYAVASNGYQFSGLGSTFYNTNACISILGDTAPPHYDLPNGAVVEIAASGASGELVLSYSGSPNCTVTIWADFTAPFA